MMSKRLLPFSLAINILGLIALIILINSMGGPHFLLFRLTHNGADAMSTGRAEMFAYLPVDNKTIMFLGDSLIQNGEWSELLNNANIINRGVIGQWSGVLQNRLPQILNNAPQSIFLMTGINDLKAHSPEDTATTLAEIVKEINILRPSTTVYLQSILPVNNGIKDTGRTNADILQLNRLAQTLCTQLECQFIPLHAHFTNESGHLDARYSDDGVHLNGEGYQKWSAQLTPYIREQNQTSAI
jgi:lysophospholipase L1-like esterase